MFIWTALSHRTPPASAIPLSRRTWRGASSRPSPPGTIGCGERWARTRLASPPAVPASATRPGSPWGRTSPTRSTTAAWRSTSDPIRNGRTGDRVEASSARLGEQARLVDQGGHGDHGRAAAGRACAITPHIEHGFAVRTEGRRIEWHCDCHR